MGLGSQLELCQSWWLCLSGLCNLRDLRSGKGSMVIVCSSVFATTDYWFGEFIDILSWSLTMKTASSIPRPMRKAWCCLLVNPPCLCFWTYLVWSEMEMDQECWADISKNSGLSDIGRQWFRYFFNQIQPWALPNITELWDFVARLVFSHC